MRTANRTAALILLVAIQAFPTRGLAEPLEVAIFEPTFTDYKLSDRLKKEVLQHYHKGLLAPGTIKPLDRRRRARDLMEHRVFPKRDSTLEEARQTCTTVGWERFLVSSLAGTKKRRVEIVVTYVDLSKGDQGIIEGKRQVRNHLKAIRDGLRRLATEVAKKVGAPPPLTGKKAP